MECTYCGQIVDKEVVQQHASTHFEQTRGIDHEGNEVPSRIEVNFLPVNR
jgi:hypothetical protein